MRLRKPQIFILVSVVVFVKVIVLCALLDNWGEFKSWNFVRLAFAQLDDNKDEEKKSLGLNLEMIRLLEEKRELLKKREEEITRKEERLNIIESSIQGKVDELNNIKLEIDKLIIKKDALEEASIQHLAKIFKGMPPQNAAAQLEKLAPEIAIKVFTRMKSRTAAKIMPFLAPRVAKRLGEEIIVKRLIEEPVKK
ncbi:MAG: MotE family protein [Nitrospinota bacterium]